MYKYKIDCKTPEMFRIVVDILSGKGYTNIWDYDSFVYKKVRYVYVQRYDYADSIYPNHRICYDNDRDDGRVIGYFTNLKAKQLTIAEVVDLPDIQAKIETQIGELSFTYDEKKGVVDIAAYNRDYQVNYNQLRAFCKEVDNSK